MHGDLNGMTRGLAGLALAACVAMPAAAGVDSVDLYNAPCGLRVATFNVSLNRSNAGDLVTELSTPGSAQPSVIAEIIQRVNPDIVLINEFDYDETGAAAAGFKANYLEVSQNGAVPVTYPHMFLAPSNTGIPSGLDLDNDGSDTGPGDSFGFGFFPGQFGMLVLSKYPIDLDNTRTFQNFLWKDMPGALLPVDPDTNDPYYTQEELDVFRLSSKSHWDVAVDVNGQTIHILASHPTPPVFDGAEDRNGRRNNDEIRFWADYITPGQASYIYDDAGQFGGLAANAPFVIVGDLNADPTDGDSVAGAATQLLLNAQVNTSRTPSSLGGTEQSAAQGGANNGHVGNPAFDTADFADTAPGNLRVDYALPSANLNLVKAGVFWPESTDPLFGLVGTFPFPSSDHRLVWVDLGIAGQTMPHGVASGDVTNESAVIWARTTVPGDVTFEWSENPDFSNATQDVVAVTDTSLPAKSFVTGLAENTRYYYRATDAAGTTKSGTFITASTGSEPIGLRFGVSGDWRGELAPYPAISNIPSRELDFFVGLGDTIYADIESPILPNVSQAMSPAEFRLKYVETLSERFGVNSWEEARASTSLLAMIDDHEVTNDFSGGADPSTDPRFAQFNDPFINETPLYTDGLDAFVAYYPIADEFYGPTGDPRTANKRKLYRSRRWGSDAVIITLDARSYRDPGLPPVVNILDPMEVANYIVATFDPTRTMLGNVQLTDLLADLQQAQDDGVLWKFVCVPEPIQNLGVLAASDRFEGYAAERTAILDYITSQGIENVVFVCADIHGTVVNDVQYQLAPFGPQIDTGAMETSTGAVAFSAPFGPTVVELGLAAGLITQEQRDLYFMLPLAGQEQFVQDLINTQLILLQYTPVGLAGSVLKAYLAAGTWTATNSYGWTEFEIDPVTRQLLITTWGIDWYTPAEVLADPADVIAREPVVYNQIAIQPQGLDDCKIDINADGAVDFDDLAILLGNWMTNNPDADLNNDGVVDFDDLSALLAGWNDC